MRQNFPFLYGLQPEILCLVLLTLCSCRPDRAVPPAEPAPPGHYFPIQIKDKKIFLQLALTDAERAKGLMYRTSLGADHGMIFIFPESSSRAFWMRNTGIPLDLAYIDKNGTLIEIHSLYPYDETQVKSRSDTISLALEMNHGWFDANRIGSGDKIDIAQLREAICRRNYSPDDFEIAP